MASGIGCASDSVWPVAQDIIYRLRVIGLSDEPFKRGG